MFLENIKNIDSFDGRIRKLEFKWGRHERPLWKAIENLSLDAQIKWIDRISSYESIACEWATALVYERSLNIKISVRANHIRALLAELQRILWGFNYMAQIFRATEDLVRIEQAMRLREYIFQGQEIFTGSRVLPQALKIGGTERDFSVGDIRKFKEILKNVEFELRMFFRDLMTETIFLERLTNVLPIPRDLARKYNWLGPVGQASGLSDDLRAKDRYGAYRDFTIKSFQAGLENNSSCDALARFQSVLFQVRQSINVCYEILVNVPDGENTASLPQVLEVPSKSAMAQVEGASGPVIATLENKKIRVSTTSMRIADHLEEILIGSETEDLDLSLASIGFSFEEADLKGSH